MTLSDVMTADPRYLCGIGLGAASCLQAYNRSETSVFYLICNSSIVVP